SMEFFINHDISSISMKKIDIIFLVLMGMVTVLFVYLLANPEAGNWLIVSKWDIGSTQNEMLIAVFLVTMLANISPFPTPYVLVIYIVGGKMNPLLVGLFASFGAIIGEMVSYFLGRGGRAVAKEHVENNERIEKMRQLAQNHPWVTMGFIYLAALTFIPDDLILFPLGLAGYSFKKAVIPCYLGKLTMVTVVAVAGAFSLEFVLEALEPAGAEWLSGMITIILMIVIIYVMLRIDIEALLSRKKK
ncbi:MAG: VTT domain-containing protein, partial [Candidatus Korarchaeota archaeon]